MEGSHEIRVTWSEWLNHLAFADELVSVGKSAAEVKTMFEDMVVACRKWGMTIRTDKLRLQCAHKRSGVRVDGHGGIPGRHHP